MFHDEPEVQEGTNAPESLRSFDRLGSEGQRSKNAAIWQKTRFADAIVTSEEITRGHRKFI